MAQLTAKQSYTAFGIVVALALVLGLVCMNLCSSSPDGPKTDSSIKLTTEQVALLNDLQSKGILSIEPQLNKAYINVSLWTAMDAKQKEDFSAAVSIYCANQKGTTAYWAEIYDKQSGQKLAKWSQAYGFDVY
jgi:hypothetical protein